jgi:hypothetical protein
MLATRERIAAANLTEFHIPLHSASKRHPDERAVLTMKQQPGNTKAGGWWWNVDGGWA